MTKKTKPEGVVSIASQGRGGSLFCAGHTHDVKHEADEAMMGCKGEEHPVDEDDVLEIVDDTLSIEKVHCRAQEIPVERLGEA